MFANNNTSTDEQHPTCFTQSNLSVVLFSAWTSLKLSASVLIIHTLTYLAYCLARGDEDYLIDTKEFAAIAFVGSFFIGFTFWLLFLSLGLCFDQWFENRLGLKILMIALLSGNLLGDVALGILLNIVNVYIHPHGSMTDYLIAQAIGVGLTLLVLSSLVCTYGTKPIFEFAFKQMQTIERALMRIFGIEGTLYLRDFDCEEFGSLIVGSCCCPGGLFCFTEKPRSGSEEHLLDETSDIEAGKETKNTCCSILKGCMSGV